MKKWITYILFFYILFSAVVPCSIFDNCEDEPQTEQTSNTDHKNDCSDCSPFSICAAAHGFTINHETVTVEPFVFNNAIAYPEYYISAKSGYYFTHFQPPRKV